MALDFYKGNPGTAAVAVLSALVAAWACPPGGKDNPLNDPDFPFSTNEVVGMINDAPTNPEIQIEFNTLDSKLEAEVGRIRFVITDLSLCENSDALNRISGVISEDRESAELHANRECGTIYTLGEGKFATIGGLDAKRLLAATEYATKAGRE